MVIIALFHTFLFQKNLTSTIMQKTRTSSRVGFF